MVRNRRSLVLLAVSAGALSSVAGSAPLDARLVSPRATWLVHVDVEAALASSAGKWVLEHQDELDLEDALEEIQEETGIDPLKELFSVTIYGAAMHDDHDDDDEDGHDEDVQVFGDDDAVIVLLVSESVQKQAERLSNEEDGIDRIVKGDLTMYRLDHGGDDLVATFLPGPAGDRRFMVLAPSRGLLSEGMEIVKGKKGPAKIEGAESPKAGSIVYLSVNDISGHLAHHAEANMFKMARGGQADIGEAGGEFFADVRVATGTEQDAKDMAHVAAGLLAMGRMMFGDEPDMQPLLAIAESAAPRAEGKTVSLSVRLPAANTLQMLNSLMRHDRDGAHEDRHERDERRERREERDERRGDNDKSPPA